MNILPVFLHPLLYIRRGGVGVQGSTQQTLETLYTETQQLVLDRSELPEELTGVSGSQIGCFFKKKKFFSFFWHQLQRETAAVGDDWTVTAGTATIHFGSFSLSWELESHWGSLTKEAQILEDFYLTWKKGKQLAD